MTLKWNDVNSMSKTLTVSPFYVEDNMIITAATGLTSQYYYITFRVKNPCVDATFTQISVPPDRIVSYKVNDEIMEVDFTGGFSMALESLCGGFSYAVVGLSTEITR